MKRIYLLALTLCIFSLHTQAAGIQKWVDENGNISYGDTPPPSVKSKIIRTNKRPSKLGKPLPRLSTSTDSDTSIKGSNTNKPINKLEPEQAKEACNQAKEDVKVIKRSSRIQLRAADGSLRYMTKAEIKERLERSQEEIDTFCK